MSPLQKLLSPLCQISLAGLLLIPAISFAHNTNHLAITIVNNSNLILNCDDFSLHKGKSVSIGNQAALANIAPQSSVHVTLTNTGKELDGHFECYTKGDALAAYLHTDYASGGGQPLIALPSSLNVSLSKSPNNTGLNGDYYATSKLASLAATPSSPTGPWHSQNGAKQATFTISNN